jgi:hypothetical protein
MALDMQSSQVAAVFYLLNCLLACKIARNQPALKNKR